jgi:hypothetical protein
VTEIHRESPPVPASDTTPAHTPPLALASRWADFAKRAAAGAHEWEPGTTGLPEYELGRATGYGECAVLLSAKIAPQWDEITAQLAIATGALRDINDAYPAAHFAHDVAHTALDQIGGIKPAPPGEAGQLRAQLAVVHGQLTSLASGLEESATATAPSKKSDIERDCATAVRAIAISITVPDGGDHA